MPSIVESQRCTFPFSRWPRAGLLDYSRLEANADLDIVCINMVGIAMLPGDRSDW